MQSPLFAFVSIFMFLTYIADANGGGDQTQFHRRPQVEFELSATLIDNSTASTLAARILFGPPIVDMAMATNELRSYFSVFYGPVASPFPDSLYGVGGISLVFAVSPQRISLVTDISHYSEFVECISETRYIFQRQFISLLVRQLQSDIALDGIYNSDSFSSDIVEGLEETETHLRVERCSIEKEQWIKCKFMIHDAASSYDSTCMYDPEDGCILYSQGNVRIAMDSGLFEVFYQLRRVEFIERQYYVEEEYPLLECPIGGMICKRYGLRCGSDSLLESARAIERIISKYGVDVSKDDVAEYIREIAAGVPGISYPGAYLDTVLWSLAKRMLPPDQIGNENWRSTLFERIRSECMG